MSCRLLLDIFVIVLRVLFFFFNDTATTEIYTLSLHDALPISPPNSPARYPSGTAGSSSRRFRDRKSTRLNSSHTVISYAVFCLKKKKTHTAGYTYRGESGLRVGRISA